jgi:hypothetical protein
MMTSISQPRTKTKLVVADDAGAVPSQTSIEVNEGKCVMLRLSVTLCFNLVELYAFILLKL